MFAYLPEAACPAAVSSAPPSVHADLVTNLAAVVSLFDSALLQAPRCTCWVPPDLVWPQRPLVDQDLGPDTKSPLCRLFSLCNVSRHSLPFKDGVSLGWVQNWPRASAPCAALTPICPCPVTMRASVAGWGPPTCPSVCKTTWSRRVTVLGWLPPCSAPVLAASLSAAATSCSSAGIDQGA